MIWIQLKNITLFLIKVDFFKEWSIFAGGIGGVNEKNDFFFGHENIHR